MGQFPTSLDKLLGGQGGRDGIVPQDHCALGEGSAEARRGHAGSSGQLSHESVDCTEHTRPLDLCAPMKARGDCRHTVGEFGPNHGLGGSQPVSMVVFTKALEVPGPFGELSFLASKKTKQNFREVQPGGSDGDDRAGQAPGNVRGQGQAEHV